MYCMICRKQWHYSFQHFMPVAVRNVFCRSRTLELVHCTSARQQPLCYAHVEVLDAGLLQSQVIRACTHMPNT